MGGGVAPLCSCVEHGSIAMMLEVQSSPELPQYRPSVDRLPIPPLIFKSRIGFFEAV